VSAMVPLPGDDSDGDDEIEDVPYVVHLAPVFHVEVEAAGSLDAQAEAMKQLVSAIADADIDFDVEKVTLEDMAVDRHEMMKQLTRGGEHGVPLESTDLDIDPEEMDEASDLGGLFDGVTEEAGDSDGGDDDT